MRIMSLSPINKDRQFKTLTFELELHVQNISAVLTVVYILVSYH